MMSMPLALDLHRRPEGSLFSWTCQGTVPDVKAGNEANPALTEPTGTVLGMSRGESYVGTCSRGYFA